MCYYASWQNFANMGSPANLTITARTASKFCARSRSQSQNIFDLDSISWVISGSWEPWPECHWEFWKQWLTNGFGYLCDSRDPFAERGQHSQMALALAIASLWFHQLTPSKGGVSSCNKWQLDGLHREIGWKAGIDLSQSSKLLILTLLTTP